MHTTGTTSPEGVHQLAPGLGERRPMAPPSGGNFTLPAGMQPQQTAQEPQAALPGHPVNLAGSTSPAPAVIAQGVPAHYPQQPFVAQGVQAMGFQSEQPIVQQFAPQVEKVATWEYGENGAGWYTLAPRYNGLGGPGIIRTPNRAEAEAWGYRIVGGPGEPFVVQATNGLMNPPEGVQLQARRTEQQPPQSVQLPAAPRGYQSQQAHVPPGMLGQPLQHAQPLNGGAPVQLATTGQGGQYPSAPVPWPPYPTTAAPLTVQPQAVHTHMAQQGTMVRLEGDPSAVEAALGMLMMRGLRVTVVPS